jgi:hypothetical protein
MKRSLATAMVAATALGLVAAATVSPAAAQGVFPPPPPPGQAGIFPAPPPAGAQGAVMPTPQQGSFSTGPGGGGGGGFGAPPPGGGGAFGGPPPSMPPKCAEFPKLREDAQKKVAVVQATGQRHGKREEMCAAVTKFSAAEGTVVKFLEENKTLCGIPGEAVNQAKATHAHTEEFREKVCAEGPKPKIPTLSDAIATPTVDTEKNTKTGRGTFDTLTGNPLAR